MDSCSWGPCTTVSAAACVQRSMEHAVLTARYGFFLFPPLTLRWRGCEAGLQTGSEILQPGLAGGPRPGLLLLGPDARHRHRRDALLPHSCGGEARRRFSAGVCHRWSPLTGCVSSPNSFSKTCVSAVAGRSGS